MQLMLQLNELLWLHSAWQGSQSVDEYDLATHAWSRSRLSVALKGTFYHCVVIFSIFVHLFTPVSPLPSPPLPSPPLPPGWTDLSHPEGHR